MATATATEAAIETVQCECGEVIGERCQWSGPKSETVRVEYMPEHLRAQHEEARNSGVYPHNGAHRIRVERACAEGLLETEEGWASIVD
jgi:hypothetical protein